MHSASLFVADNANCFNVFVSCWKSATVYTLRKSWEIKSVVKLEVLWIEAFLNPIDNLTRITTTIENRQCVANIQLFLSNYCFEHPLYHWIWQLLHLYATEISLFFLNLESWLTVNLVSIWPDRCCITQNEKSWFFLSTIFNFQSFIQLYVRIIQFTIDWTITKCNRQTRFECEDFAKSSDKTLNYAL